MANDCYLGVDLGTSALKAVLVDRRQRLVGAADVTLAISRPKPGWSEQDPGDWWRAFLAACRKLRRRHPGPWRAIKAIGFSGQMHGVVLLDRTGKPVRPAILWNDNRAVGEARELNRTMPGLGHIAGVIAMASFTAPKMLWLKGHEPRRLAMASHLLAPKDYLRFRLSGRTVTDPCDAAGMLLIDEASRSWSSPIVAACGFDPAILPEIAEGSSPSASLSKSAGQELGLAPGTIIATGTGDAAAGAISIGAVNDGDGFVSLGTSAQYFVSTASYRPQPERLVHAYCHGLPRRWFQMAALLNGASPLAWMKRAFGIANLDTALAAVARATAAPSPLLFLPYLEGERTPHDDPLARAAFHGISPTTSRNEMLQAVLDGVALALADCQDVLSASGTVTTELSIIGGGTKSLYWMGLIAAALDRPLKLHEGSAFGSAFGAARLARLAVTGETPEEVCVKPRVSRLIRPDPRLAEAYRKKLPQFRALYLALRPLNRP
ncbi:MAG: xylulokinase [Rhizobiales bacterium]|nr:xylulokinase [Hyphomicrobiales bacterium]